MYYHISNLNSAKFLKWQNPELIDLAPSNPIPFQLK
jgi:hypothetical protein